MMASTESARNEAKSLCGAEAVPPHDQVKVEAVGVRIAQRAVPPSLAYGTCAIGSSLLSLRSISSPRDIFFRHQRNGNTILVKYRQPWFRCDGLTIFTYENHDTVNWLVLSNYVEYQQAK